MTKVHPTAIISPGAELGSDVEVEAYSVIDEDVVIGDGCRISTGVRIHNGTKLGKSVRVFHGAALGGEPQDLKFTGERTELIVGDNTTLREFCTLNRGTKATGRTVVGSDVLIMAYAHVAHDCYIGNNVILVNSVHLAGHVEIEDYAIVGGVVPIHQFVRIGRHSMIGGGLRVPKDVPPYILAGGQPLRYFGLNAVGLRRRGISTDVRNVLKQVYKLIYLSSMNITQAIARIRQEYAEVEEAMIVVDFIEKSKRGLLPGPRSLGDESSE